MFPSSNLLAGVNTTARALQIQQLTMDTAGGNIANANTPQYGRADVQVLAGGLDGPPQTAQLSRAQAPLSEQTVLDARRSLAFSEAHYDALRVQVVQVLGDMSGNSLVAGVDDFFASWTDLAVTPASPSLRQQVVDGAVGLSERFGAVSRGLRSQQDKLDREVVSLIGAANASVSEVASLNAQIRSLTHAGQSSVDAENRRAQEVDRLVRDLGVDVIGDSDGSVRLLLAGGISIVSGDAALAVGTRTDPTTGFQHVVADPSADSNLDRFITGGTLGALLTTRDTDVGGFLATLDQFCADLVGQVNTQHQAGFGLDAATNRNFFVPAPTPVAGFSAQMAVDPAVATNIAAVAAASAAAVLPSESVNSDLIAALGDGLLAAGNTQTYAQSLRALASQAGTLTARAQRDTDRGRVDLLGAEVVRNAQIGVSQEEQLTLARRAQMAYNVQLKVMSIQLGCLDSLLALGR